MNDYGTQNTSFEPPGFSGGLPDISQFDDEYTEAEVSEQKLSVPDGSYQVNVEGVELTTAKSSGAPMLKWRLRILGPSNINRVIYRNSVIDSKKIPYIKKDLYACGLELSKFSDLVANLNRLLDVKLEITAKTNGDYQNVYFNRQIVQTETNSVSTDDIPF